MRIDHPALVAVMLCSFAGLALLALHPKQSLQLEGEIAMLEPAVALQRLDAASDIDFDRNLALTHAALAIDAGEFQVAKKVLRQIQTNGQDSPEIEMMLANASRYSHSCPPASASPEERLVAARSALESVVGKATFTVDDKPEPTAAFDGKLEFMTGARMTFTAQGVLGPTKLTAEVRRATAY